MGLISRVSSRTYRFVIFSPTERKQQKKRIIKIIKKPDIQQAKITIRKMTDQEATTIPTTATIAELKEAALEVVANKTEETTEPTEEKTEEPAVEAPKIEEEKPTEVEAEAAPEEKNEEAEKTEENEQKKEEETPAESACDQVAIEIEPAKKRPAEEAPEEVVEEKISKTEE